MNASCPAIVAAAPALFNAAHRWKVLGVGVAANASFSACANGMPTTAIWLRSGYHLSNTELGVALGAMGLGVALSELPWGMATDRWGDRPVLLTGLLGTLLALLTLMLWITPQGASRAIAGCRWRPAWRWWASWAAASTAPAAAP